jgi:triosephosphate isomerase
MSRRKFIAGNWKMNMTIETSIQLIDRLIKDLHDVKDVDIAVCPPSVYIQQISMSLIQRESSIEVGAQNVYHKPNGAFTGEISVAMLQDLGVKYVILGHSERRHILHETNEDVNLKTLAALAGNLIPIVCVGELLSEREAGTTEKVVKEQIEGSFANVSADDIKKCVIAYEPVWAIGTGKVATPDQAEEVHVSIRNLIEKKYGKEIAQSVIIQYGGSVNDENAKEILAKPNVDGALVGGASLKPDPFVKIVKSAL